MKIIENRNKYFIFSAAVYAIGLLFMIINSARGVGMFNYDVEFSGGTSIYVELGQEFNNDDITRIVQETTGEGTPQVQKILGTNDVSIKMKTLDTETLNALTGAIVEEYGITDDNITTSLVSAVISTEMQNKALLAISVASLAMLVYVAIRFRDFFTGASAILTQIHALLFVIFAYAIFRIPLNYSFIAVLLTILGYSINNTIVIFDRVRENRKIMVKPKPTKAHLLNTSLNQTMKRSLYTSITTLLTVVCLYIFGVPTLKDFSLPIIIGIVCGTFSSICMSCTFWYIITGSAKNESTQA